MALQTSGAISLDQIHVEANGTTGTQASLNDSDIRNLNEASGRVINNTLGTYILVNMCSKCVSTHERVIV